MFALNLDNISNFGEPRGHVMDFLWSRETSKKLLGMHLKRDKIAFFKSNVISLICIHFKTRIFAIRGSIPLLRSFMYRRSLRVTNFAVP